LTKSALQRGGHLDQVVLLARALADQLRAREKLGLFLSEALLQLALPGGHAAGHASQGCPQRVGLERAQPRDRDRHQDKADRGAFHEMPAMQLPGKANGRADR
jgi:hypothetical protein